MVVEAVEVHPRRDLEARCQPARQPRLLDGQHLVRALGKAQGYRQAQGAGTENGRAGHRAQYGQTPDPGPPPHARGGSTDGVARRCPEQRYLPSRRPGGVGCGTSGIAVPNTGQYHSSPEAQIPTFAIIRFRTRGPNGWPFIYQGLLAMWDISF